ERLKRESPVELLAPGEKIITFGDEDPAAAPEAALAPPKKPAAAKPKPAAKTPGPAKETEDVAGVDEEEPTEAKVPRIKLVEPPTVEKVAAKAPDEVTVEADDDDDDDEIMLDPKAFDWGAARQEAIQARGGDEVTAEPPEFEEDPETAAIAAAREKLPTVMRREGSRYERHSASLPKIGSEGESTLSDVSKVSKRRRRRAAYRDDKGR
ncbi:MAG: hypothetical protein V3R84_04135, partial [Acidimicrobiia bacterium]